MGRSFDSYGFRRNDVPGRSGCCGLVDRMTWLVLSAAGACKTTRPRGSCVRAYPRRLSHGCPAMPSKEGPRQRTYVDVVACVSLAEQPALTCPLPPPATSLDVRDSRRSSPVRRARLEALSRGSSARTSPTAGQRRALRLDPGGVRVVDQGGPKDARSAFVMASSMLSLSSGSRVRPSSREGC